MAGSRSETVVVAIYEETIDGEHFRQNAAAYAQLPARQKQLAP